MRTHSARLVAEALFQDEHGNAPPPGELDSIETELADFVRSAGSASHLMLAGCLLAVSLLVPIFARRFATLGGLDLDARRHALEKLEESDLSLPFLAVKAILCFLHYEHPDAAARIGFDGKCLSGRPRQ